MRLLRRGVVVAAVVALAGLWPTAAWAHPLGNFTVNRAAALELSPGRLDVRYIVDHAEIPTQQERPAIDRDDDAEFAEGELTSWAERAAGGLPGMLRVHVDGTPVALTVVCASASTASGQGGLPVLRLEVGLSGTLPPSGTLTWIDPSDPGRLGWREVSARSVGATAITASTVPARSPSDLLRSYPDDLLADPLDVREARVTFAGGAAAAETASRPCGSAGPAVAAPSGGGFLGLLDRKGTPLVVALTLLLAAGFGAMHALGPGHGKTLIAGTIVGSGARVRQAVAVGGAVSVMHTASVLGLGVLVLGLERTFRPERVYPWLGLASGLVALGLGAWLLVRRIGAWSDRGTGDVDGSERAHGAEHGHTHGADGHSHDLPDGPVLSRHGLTALAVAGGILPSPTALVVLLSAISLGRAAFGLALIAAFSLGLAGALVGVGLVTIRARDVVAGRLSSRLGRAIPVVSSAAVVLVGLVLTVRGILEL